MTLFSNLYAKHSRSIHLTSYSSRVLILVRFYPGGGSGKEVGHALRLVNQLLPKQNVVTPSAPSKIGIPNIYPSGICSVTPEFFTDIAIIGSKANNTVTDVSKNFIESIFHRDYKRKAYSSIEVEQSLQKLLMLPERKLLTHVGSLYFAGDNFNTETEFTSISKINFPSSSIPYHKVLEAMTVCKTHSFIDKNKYHVIALDVTNRDHMEFCMKYKDHTYSIIKQPISDFCVIPEYPYMIELHGGNSVAATSFKYAKMIEVKTIPAVENINYWNAVSTIVNGPIDHIKEDLRCLGDLYTKTREDRRYTQLTTEFSAILDETLKLRAQFKKSTINHQKLSLELYERRQAIYLHPDNDILYPTFYSTVTPTTMVIPNHIFNNMQRFLSDKQHILFPNHGKIQSIPLGSNKTYETYNSSEFKKMLRLFVEYSYPPEEAEIILHNMTVVDYGLEYAPILS